tara:strand:+ start:960 stop:1370 length:411 start_codon:yes stop_codon:yes gene_type:complete
MGDPADAGTKGDCWRRANCEPAEFSGASGQYDVYVKAKGYKLWGGFNSYDGHGGSEIDNNPVILSVPQCKARCDADAKCSCVTYEVRCAAACLLLPPLYSPIDFLTILPLSPSHLINVSGLVEELLEARLLRADEV